MKTFTSGNEDQPPAEAGTGADVEVLIRALDGSGRYRRDSRLGRIYHRGATSYRELRPTDSFHVVIDGGRVSVHVDRISPIKSRPDGSARLSITRIFAHNLAGAHGELARRMRRRVGADRGAVGAPVVLTVPLGDS